MALVCPKGLAALRKVGLDRAAEALAAQAQEFGAASNSMTLEFLGKEEETDGDFLVKLTITVEAVA